MSLWERFFEKSYVLDGLHTPSKVALAKRKVEEGKQAFRGQICKSLKVQLGSSSSDDDFDNDTKKLVLQR